MEIHVSGNGLIIYNNYLLITGDRSISSSKSGIFLFSDGTIANLNLGIIVGNTKKETHNPVAIITLEPGLQTIEIGSKNLNPEIKSWPYQKLEIDYKGKVEVTPSSDGKITIPENEFCIASEKDGIVSVSQVNYSTITINGTTSSIGDISSGNIPTLQISAPPNTTITNKSAELTFDVLESIELQGGSLTGNRANSISGVAENSVEINIQEVETLALEAQSFSTLRIGSATDVKITSQSSTKVYVSGKIKSITINGESFVDIIGGTFEKVLIAKSSSTLNIDKFLCIDELIISGDSFVNVNGETARTVNILESSGKLSLCVKNSEQITINCDSAVTIEGDYLGTINIVYADGAVDIVTKTSHTISITSDSRVNITSPNIEKINVEYADGAVDVKVDAINEITVKSDSAVSIKTMAGEQVVKIEADGRVELALATAKSITVVSDSAVNISANKYLSEPHVVADGKVKITERK